MTKTTLCRSALALSLTFLAACGSHSGSDKSTPGSAVSKPDGLSAESISKVERFCGDCHALPIPATFPKLRWPDEVRRGYQFYIESQRTDLDEPVLQDAIRYYQSAAPDEVLVPRSDSEPDVASAVSFRLASAPIRLSAADSAVPSISQIRPAAGNSILIADMSGGGLWKWLPDGENAQSKPELIYKGRNTCRATPCDWNSDGREDYLVAEMGSFPVGDHLLGSISLLISKPDGFDNILLASGLSRVVEAKPIDYDDDGDMDVIVADFGWHKTGALRLLRNQGGSPTSPQMIGEIIDNKHGALGIEVADLNQDQHLDFVVAYGQEYETVETYLWKSPGNYEHTIIDRLKDPSYNASSFHLNDVDGDGRVDIVHTCGDTMDSLLPKPYHGVRWIQNVGEGRWQAHELGLLVGALNATSADFDGDGDLDIAAVGLFPDASRSTPGTYNSVCWWEQREPLKFIKHAIERDTLTHAACLAKDVNGDGRVDLLVGQWLSADESVVKIYYNTPAR